MFELEFLQLQYEHISSEQKKERTCLFHVPYFKSQQNTSCSGQKGQITSLESVTEEGVRVKRGGEQKQEILSFKWGDEKCFFWGGG